MPRLHYACPEGRPAALSRRKDVRPAPRSGNQTSLERAWCPSVNHESHGSNARDLLSKVPQVTLGFWIIKILATTVGETGGDALSMTLNLGYAVSSLVLLAFFAITLTAQVKAKRYHPVAYWAVVVATTTVGTTVSALKIHQAATCRGSRVTA